MTSSVISTSSGLESVVSHYCHCVRILVAWDGSGSPPSSIKGGKNLTDVKLSMSFWNFVIKHILSETIFDVRAEPGSSLNGLNSSQPDWLEPWGHYVFNLCSCSYGEKNNQGHCFKPLSLQGRKVSGTWQFLNLMHTRKVKCTPCELSG